MHMEIPCLTLLRVPKPMEHLVKIGVQRFLVGSTMARLDLAHVLSKEEMP